MCLPPSNRTVNSITRAVQLPSDHSCVEVCLCLWPFRALQLCRLADSTERKANSRWRHGLIITASTTTTYKNPESQTCVRSGVFLFEKWWHEGALSCTFFNQLQGKSVWAAFMIHSADWGTRAPWNGSKNKEHQILINSTIALIMSDDPFLQFNQTR